MTFVRNRSMSLSARVAASLLRFYALKEGHLLLVGFVQWTENWLGRRYALRTFQDTVLCVHQVPRVFGWVEVQRESAVRNLDIDVRDRLSLLALVVIVKAKRLLSPMLVSTHGHICKGWRRCNCIRCVSTSRELLVFGACILEGYCWVSKRYVNRLGLMQTAIIWACHVDLWFFRKRYLLQVLK